MLAREACRLWAGEVLGLMDFAELGDLSLIRSLRRTADGGAGPEDNGETARVVSMVGWDDGDGIADADSELCSGEGWSMLMVGFI